MHGHGPVSVDEEALALAIATLGVQGETIRLRATTIALCATAIDGVIALAAPRSAEAVAVVVSALSAQAERIEALIAALRWTAERYRLAEQWILEMLARVIDDTGRVVGSAVSALVIGLGPLLLLSGLPLAVALLRAGGGKAVLDAVGAHPRALVNPAAASMLRVAVSGVDGAMAGMLGISPAALHVMGGGSLPQRGVEAGARVVRAEAGLGGALVESPARAVAMSGPAGTGATSLRGLLDRMPETARDGLQIRIDRIDAGDDRRWIVYLGGTVDPGDETGSEAFDMTSNVAAVAGQSAGSERAALDAMAQAGIGAEDRVLLVGYSQGGIVAARLASEPGVNPDGVITLGAPVSGIETGVPTLELVHSDDLVPALGGFRGTVDDDRVTVVREAFADHEPPEGDLLAAHHLPEYRETASLADRSDDPHLERIVSGLAPYLSGGAVTTTYWAAERIRPVDRPAAGGSGR